MCYIHSCYSDHSRFSIDASYSGIWVIVFCMIHVRDHWIVIPEKGNDTSYASLDLDT